MVHLLLLLTTFAFFAGMVWLGLQHRKSYARWHESYARSRGMRFDPERFEWDATPRIHYTLRGRAEGDGLFIGARQVCMGGVRTVIGMHCDAAQRSASFVYTDLYPGRGSLGAVTEGLRGRFSNEAQFLIRQIYVEPGKITLECKGVDEAKADQLIAFVRALCEHMAEEDFGRQFKQAGIMPR